MLDRFVEYSRAVNGVCTRRPNMTDHCHTFSKKGEPRRTCHPSGKGGEGRDALPRREEPGARQWHASGIESEDGDNRVIKLGGSRASLDTDATWEKEIPEQLDHGGRGEKMMERQGRERQEGSNMTLIRSRDDTRVDSHRGPASIINEQAYVVTPGRYMRAGMVQYTVEKGAGPRHQRCSVGHLEPSLLDPTLSSTSLPLAHAAPPVPKNAILLAHDLITHQTR